MLERPRSLEPIPLSSKVEKYIDFNRKLQRWAWLISSVPILVIAAAVLVGRLQLEGLQKKIEDARGELAKTTGENSRLNKENSYLQKKAEGLTDQINDHIAASTAILQSTPMPPVSVDGYPLKISIVLVDVKKREAAAKAKEVLEAHGYKVDAIDEKPDEIIHETTVRFFQYDRNTVAVGVGMVRILRQAGFTIRTEFDDEFVGQPPPPFPGAFEVWIGLNPSYQPSGVEH